MPVVYLRLTFCLKEFYEFYTSRNAENGYHRLGSDDSSIPSTVNYRDLQIRVRNFLLPISWKIGIRDGQIRVHYDVEYFLVRIIDI